jgi:hypothetical protein
MNIYEAFETDAQAIEEGRWLEIVFQGQAVCSVCVRSASPDLNPELRKAMTDQALGIVGKANGAGPAAVEKSVSSALRNPDLERKLFAAAVVTAWKGVTDRNGKPLKFTTRNAEKVFKDLPKLFEQIKLAAYRWETFRASVVSASLGNSETSSGTKSAA